MTQPDEYDPWDGKVVHWLPQSLNETDEMQCGLRGDDHPGIRFSRAQNEVTCRNCLKGKLPEEYSGEGPVIIGDEMAQLSAVVPWAMSEEEVAAQCLPGQPFDWSEYQRQIAPRDVAREFMISGRKDDEFTVPEPSAMERCEGLQRERGEGRFRRREEEEPPVRRPVPEVQAGPGCPDGGKCHHQCDSGCWRVVTSSPLTGVFPDDKWPQDVVTMHVGGRYDIKRQPSPARVLEEAVASALAERYGPEWKLRTMVEGLRLEVHPLLRHRMLQDPREWQSTRVFTEEQLWAQFRVPVIVSDHLPPGSWRLVIITEDVLGRGEP